ncbi:MAG: MBL fold metallo-hydrolase [Clostridia bacterium]|nr:MBL fold metallo-hydrolase [Clostridia bacterium]
MKDNANAKDRFLPAAKLKYGNTNTYLIRGTKGNLLVDTDWAGTLPAFYRAIKEQNIRLSDISCILVTHYHPDHMGIAAELTESGIPLVIFDVQLPYIHFPDSVFAKEKNRFYKPVDEKRAKILSCGESRAFLTTLGISGEILHTPGHSEDSVSLILDNGTIFIGDLPPYSALPAIGDETVRNSYKAILALGAARICYGHHYDEAVGLFPEGTGIYQPLPAVRK